MITRLTLIIILLTLSPMPGAVALVQAQENNDLRLEKAYYLEEVRGQLDEAIAVYRSIFADSTVGPSLRAAARLQIARCLQKKGDPEAYSVYRTLIGEFPEQHRIVNAATLALEHLQEPKIPPLVEWYCRRIPLDPMTSFSHNGRYQVATEWSSGNLVIRDGRNSTIRRLTDLDSTKTGPVFAYHGVWSDNDRLIAFTEYREPGTLELKTITVQDAKTKLIYRARGQRVFPQDWSGDNTKVLCEIVQNSDQGPLGNHFLAFIGLDGSYSPLVSVTSNSRGLRLSPDDRFLAYDRLVGNNRHIFIYTINTGVESRITSGITGNVGYESPVWSEDGRFLLYRSKLRGRSDLWAVPISEGAAAGPPLLVQSDLTGVFLAIAGVGDLHGISLHPPQLPAKTDIPTAGFQETFTADTLSKEWNVWSWDHSDVYGNGSFGRYSLKANPGYLRYSLDPMMHESWGRQYIPTWDKWFFCYYPSLEISRLITGCSYRLDFRADYSMVTGANDRRITVKLVFHPREKPGDYLLITRNVGATAISLQAVMYNDFAPVSHHSCLAAADTVSTRHIPYRFVIIRKDTIFALQAAGNGEPLKPIVTVSIPAASPNNEQVLILSGNSWFVPAMSYVDLDYVYYSPIVSPKKKKQRPSP